MNESASLAPGAVLELNPALDRNALAAAYGEHRRIHFPNILTRGAADRLYRALHEETPWALTFNKGAESFDGENLTEEERNKLALGAWRRARDGFQYFYDRHGIAQAGKPYPKPAHYFAGLAGFLNGEAFLALARQVTGLETIAAADAEARLYRPGDLFTTGNGQRGDTRKLAYYTLSMTQGWRADWGGLVQFYDSTGHIAEGFAPAFNSLMLFRVPQSHSVTQVAAYGGYRYTVEGWLYGRDV